MTRGRWVAPHRPWIPLSALVVASILAAAAPALAGDWTWTGDIGGIGPDAAVEVQYWDGPVYRGNFTVVATNTGSEAWGDFHLEIYDPMGGQDISHVDFLDASMGGEDPTSSQSGLTWVIDAVTIGSTIDLYFCSDPVMPGETAVFSVYIANPDEVSFYGVMLYPTPVPPNGVCCSPDGTCTLVCTHDCLPPSIWYGDMISCEPNPCEPPTPVESSTWGKIKATYK